MLGSIISNTANRIRSIPNPELRDAAAYILDTVHSARCTFLGSADECEAVAGAFSEPVPGAVDTKARQILQPVSEFFGWYFTGPVTRRISTLQEWDSDWDIGDGDGGYRWRWNPEILAPPWRMWPGLANEWQLLAKFAAARTWYSADMFIAAYIAEAAPRIATNMHTVPLQFFDAIPEVGEETATACYRHSLEVLASMAREEVENSGSTGEWAEALAEAIEGGLLWD
jgi:hypothetical protein